MEGNLCLGPPILRNPKHCLYRAGGEHGPVQQAASSHLRETRMHSIDPVGNSISGYCYTSSVLGCVHSYLLPVLQAELARISLSTKKVFDLGCGNGSVANWFTQQGYEVIGVDPSAAGVAEAHAAYPAIPIHQGSCYDPLKDRYGQFPLVVSLEVVEHVYAPRLFARCVHELLEDGGYALISTPYHGYWKNLALALAGKMDEHFTALWDHGHIKFWSPKTITQLFAEAGIVVERVHRVGRIPALAKSMVVVARKMQVA
jgi:2-polyprenyl-3-methyl-5-hydroxy-6-metoxy-1,4-benzoquinol methylase